MLAELPAGVLEAGVVAGAVAVLPLVAWDVRRARRQRELSGWRVLQRDRIARVVAKRPPLTRLQSTERGWQALQRDRIVRRAR
jgi:hypothetical protein